MDYDNDLSWTQKLRIYAGPESSEVILVSAAHCNFVCKVLDKLKSCLTYPFQDEGSNIVEICCCRKPTFPESCLPRFPIDDQRSSYCGKNPSLQPAKPSERDGDKGRSQIPKRISRAPMLAAILLSIISAQSPRKRQRGE